jgi:hypothetical protein
MHTHDKTYKTPNTSPVRRTQNISIKYNIGCRHLFSVRKPLHNSAHCLFTTVRNASSQKCVLPLHNSAYCLFTTVRTASSQQCVLPLHNSAYCLFTTVRAASSQQCVLPLHNSAKIRQTICEQHILQYATCPCL